MSFASHFFNFKYVPRSLSFKHCHVLVLTLKERKINESLSYCEICFEKYAEAGQKTPLVLPCGHSVCKGCCGQLPKRRCATCRAPFYASSKLPINYALLACLDNATSSSALKKRPAEREISRNYSVEELLEIFEKKRRLSDLHVQIEAKNVEYKSLTAFMDKQKEHLAATVASVEQRIQKTEKLLRRRLSEVYDRIRKLATTAASVEQSIQSTEELLRKAHQPEVTAKQAAVEETERKAQIALMEMNHLKHESRKLDPNED